MRARDHGKGEKAKPLLYNVFKMAPSDRDRLLLTYKFCKMPEDNNRLEVYL